MSKQATPLSSSLQTYLRVRKERVDRALDRLVPPASEPPQTLHEALRYSLFAGGKRIRPILCLLACRACGERETTALSAACSLEMVHTYSLVHDDLPCMDDDDFRRGKPTCHKKYGEAMAVLVGDALLTQAFEVLSTRIRDAERAMAVTRVLSRAIGTLGMVGGQVLDLEGEGEPVTRERVSEIHRLKTGCLIEAASTMGAILAGASRDGVDRLRAYGASVGLAFQIVDDILDEEESSEVLGKTSGRDRELNKMTYPAAYGMEGAKKAAREAIETAEAKVKDLPDAGLLVDFARMIIERRA